MTRLPATATLRAQLRLLCPQWRIPEDLAFRHLTGGYSNHNFRFVIDSQAYVLRLHRGPPQFGALLRERQLLDRASAIVTPAAVGQVSPQGHLVTRWQDGALLVDCRPDPQLRVAYLRHLHRALARTFVDGPVYAPRELGWLARRRRKMPGVVRQALSRHLDLGPWNRSRATAICHNDLNPWNVLCPEPATDDRVDAEHTRWCTLDWMTWGRNDPLFDLLALCSDLALDAQALRHLGAALTGQAVPLPRWRAVWRRYWLREFAFACGGINTIMAPATLRAQRQLALERLKELR